MFADEIVSINADDVDAGGAESRHDNGRSKATWKRGFKLPWREAGPPNHLDDIKWIRATVGRQ